MKKVLLNLLGNLTIVTVFVLVIQLIVYFIWNTAVVWTVPQLEPIGYRAALGISITFCLLNYSVDFWLKRITEMRRVKSLITLDLLSEAQMNILSLQTQILLMKTMLINKGIITLEEAIGKTKDTP
jgi:hypothetical protein